MTVNEIMDYVLTSPQNTNPNILRPALNELAETNKIYTVTWYDTNIPIEDLDSWAELNGWHISLPTAVPEHGLLTFSISCSSGGITPTPHTSDAEIEEVENYTDSSDDSMGQVYQVSNVTKNLAIHWV